VEVNNTSVADNNELVAAKKFVAADGSSRPPADMVNILQRERKEFPP
jgi:hypothetical protein